MDTDRHIWRVWISALRRWGLEEWVAALLEGTGSLSLLGAQMIYLGQPLLNLTLPAEHLDAAARVLEDEPSKRAFVQMLREAPSL